jgi:hypothetical protein
MRYETYQVTDRTHERWDQFKVVTPTGGEFLMRTFIENHVAQFPGSKVYGRHRLSGALGGEWVWSEWELVLG